MGMSLMTDMTYPILINFMKIIITWFIDKVINIIETHTKISNSNLSESIQLNNFDIVN